MQGGGWLPPWGQTRVTCPVAMGSQCQQDICIKALISCHAAHLYQLIWEAVRGSPTLQ